MRISLLTSSRADYGIYLPLLQKLKDDAYFELNIIAFGSHTSEKYGHTVDNIISDGFEVQRQIETVLGDSPKEISKSVAKTIESFATLWEMEKEKTDLIVCLGDRYEMFGAVLASLPFNIPVAHIHGGETTLGAIDNVFRHSLSLIAKYHFTSLESYSRKIEKLNDNVKDIYNVGSLSLDNLESLKLLSKNQFKEKFNIDISLPTMLVTFHPETISFKKNKDYIKVISSVLRRVEKYQIVITLPNTDTSNGVIREEFEQLSNSCENIITVDNFGIQGYFSAIKYCSFLFGNTSSGIIEAASFKKYVINIGDRQKGRVAGSNILNIEIDEKKLLTAINKVEAFEDFNGVNIYKTSKSTSQQIIEILKTF